MLIRISHAGATAWWLRAYWAWTRPWVFDPQLWGGGRKEKRERESKGVGREREGKEVRREEGRKKNPHREMKDAQWMGT